MELPASWTIIRKRWLLILFIGLLGTGGAAYLQSQQVPQYRTTTTLFLNPAAANPLLPYQATKTVVSVANTYIEFMRTRSFANLVAEQSKLQLAPDQILAALTTQYVPDTQFFRIIATSSDPVAAQTIANTAAQTLLAENVARQQAEQQQIQSQRNQDPERQQLTELRNSLQEELKLHGRRIEDLQGQIANLEVRSPSAQNDERLTQMRSELVSLQQARAQTLNSLAQVQSALVTGSSAATTAAPDTAVIVDPAPLPDAALPIPFVRNVIVSLILSLGAGVALALGLEFLDYTVKSPESLERAYGVPAQGVVGVVPGQNQRIEGKANPAYQLTVSAPQSPAAESVRSLRTSVQIAGLNRSIRSILITSAGPGEGKTFIAANLAVSIAQYGGSVILVDLDLRKPTLHGAFGLPREPGFTNLVIGRDGDTLETIRPQIDTILQRAHNRDALRHQGGVAAGLSLSLTSARSLLQDVETDDPEVKLMIADVHHQIDRSDDFAGYLQPSGVPNLRVLTCGTIPPNPSELLGSPRAAALMARLEEIADVVVYDSPPAGIVTDAVILAPRMDAIIQVVRAGKTRIDLMRRCKTMIEHASGKLLGPVLNQVRLSEMGSYSYYYYYGYSDKSNDRRSRNGASQHNGRNGTGPGDTGRKG